MQKFPDIGARIVHNGGEVANHTVTHKDLSTLTDEEVIGEITGMQQIAEKQNIAVVPFFRFPYGAPTKKTITLANDLGYVAVRWDGGFARVARSERRTRRIVRAKTSC